MSKIISYLIIFVIVFLAENDICDGIPKKYGVKYNCPVVRTADNIEIPKLQGKWYVIKYYASSEEAQIYKCMRTIFSQSNEKAEISMNFTYIFKEDPENENLYGNITWRVPNPYSTSHWIHSESYYEGVYNTYVLSIDLNGDKSWMLLLHCAEKSGISRFLSSFIMARQQTLSENVISYLKEKLTKYDVDLQYLFDMDQMDCKSNLPLYYRAIKNSVGHKVIKHPLSHHV